METNVQKNFKMVKTRVRKDEEIFNKITESVSAISWAIMLFCGEKEDSAIKESIKKVSKIKVEEENITMDIKNAVSIMKQMLKGKLDSEKGVEELRNIVRFFVYLQVAEE